MSRKCKQGVIKAFMDYCEETEVPAIFAAWSAVSTLSATLGRSCFIDQGHYQIYPNMYIVLVAGSGLCRKSTAIAIANKLLKGIKPKVEIFAQKCTPEALIKGLADAHLDVNEKTNNILVRDGEGILIADELSTLIDSNAFRNGMIPLLTSLWDSPEKFEYHTKKDGVQSIDKCCLSLFGGSTIDWIKTAVPVEAIGGGFTSRVIFVFRKHPEKLRLRTKTTEKELIIKGNILHDLHELRNLEGEFVLSEDAWKLCETEYERFAKNNPFKNLSYLDGYCSRRHVNLFKMSLLNCAQRLEDKRIIAADVSQALKLLNLTEKHMPEVLKAIASHETGANAEYVLTFIKKHTEVSRHILVSSLRHKIPILELDAIIVTLEEARELKVIIKGNKTVYQAQTKDIALKPETISFTEKLLTKS